MPTLTAPAAARAAAQQRGLALPAQSTGLKKKQRKAAAERGLPEGFPLGRPMFSGRWW
jgi:hypothetical protein